MPRDCYPGRLLRMGRRGQGDGGDQEGRKVDDFSLCYFWPAGAQDGQKAKVMAVTKKALRAHGLKAWVAALVLA